MPDDVLDLADTVFNLAHAGRPDLALEAALSWDAETLRMARGVLLVLHDARPHAAVQEAIAALDELIDTAGAR